MARIWFRIVLKALFTGGLAMAEILIEQIKPGQDINSIFVLKVKKLLTILP